MNLRFTYTPQSEGSTLSCQFQPRALYMHACHLLIPERQTISFFEGHACISLDLNWHNIGVVWGIYYKVLEVVIL
jgi:hypothetical protein